MKILPTLLLVATVVVPGLAGIGSEGKTATFLDRQVNYHDYGNSKAQDAVVFIHGWTCNASFWRGNLSAFKRFRTIAIDLPGHGRSSSPKGDYSMAIFADSIEAVMRDAGVRRAVLVGHSMGTPVIREFYRRHPSKASALIIVDGALRPYLSSDVFERFFAPVRADYEAKAPAFIDGMVAPVGDAALRSWIKSEMLKTPGHVALAAMDGMGDEKIWSKDRILIPVLAVMANSPAWKDDEKEYFKTVAPDLEFHMWRNVSHFLMMERPKEFNSLVLDFIERRKLL